MATFNEKLDRLMARLRMFVREDGRGGYDGLREALADILRPPVEYTGTQATFTACAPTDPVPKETDR